MIWQKIVALKTTTMEVEPSTEPSGPWLSLSPWSFSSPTLLSKCSSRRPDSGRWLRDWAEAPAPPVGSWQQPIAAGLKGTGWWSGGGGRERQRGREESRCRTQQTHKWQCQDRTCGDDTRAPCRFWDAQSSALRTNLVESGLYALFWRRVKGCYEDQWPLLLFFCWFVCLKSGGEAWTRTRFSSTTSETTVGETSHF